MIGPTRASTSGARSDSPPPPAADDAVPGPSGANANPDEFDTRRSEVARVLLSGGQQRGRGAGKRSQPQSGAAGAAKRSRSEFTDSDQQVNEALEALKTLCRNRNIEVKDSLHTLLELCPAQLRLPLIRKITCYFTHVDQSVVSNTETITSMIGQSEVGRRVEQLLKVTDTEIATVARCQHLKSISTMQNNKGFPDHKKIEVFLSQPCLQKDGRLNESLLKPVSSIQAGKGIPADDQCSLMSELLSLPALCPGGGGRSGS